MGSRHRQLISFSVFPYQFGIRRVWTKDLTSFGFDGEYSVICHYANPIPISKRQLDPLPMQMSFVTVDPSTLTTVADVLERLFHEPALFRPEDRATFAIESQMYGNLSGPVANPDLYQPAIAEKSSKL